MPPLSGSKVIEARSHTPAVFIRRHNTRPNQVFQNELNYSRLVAKAGATLVLAEVAVEAVWSLRFHEDRNFRRFRENDSGGDREYKRLGYCQQNEWFACSETF